MAIRIGSEAIGNLAKLLVQTPSFQDWEYQDANSLVALVIPDEKERTINERFFGSGFMQDRGKAPAEVLASTMGFLDMYGQLNYGAYALKPYLMEIRDILQKKGELSDEVRVGIDGVLEKLPGKAYPVGDR